MTDARLLEVRGLEVRFATEDGIVRAVDGVDFELDEGRVLGIVGESGSGKTVTALTILGLTRDQLTGAEPAAPSWGTIHEDGWPLREIRLEHATLEEFFVQVTANQAMAKAD